MRIAVVGGTGTLGALVVSELAARGDEVRVVSRRKPAAPLAPGVAHRRADLVSGEGLADALAGVEAVVDAADALRAARAVLVEGSRRLLAAEAVAGVVHHVAISIVGCDRVALRYYDAKVAQEEAVASGPVPWSILRATQFHPLLDGIFTATARARVVPAGRHQLQPIDPLVVARRVVEALDGGPAGRLPNVAGPRAETLSELSRAWRARRDRRAVALRVPSFTRAGRAMRDGALCDLSAAADGPTFAQWLARR
jgi:uncharacterized protein YbjT (DUF2867 family)